MAESTGTELVDLIRERFGKELAVKTVRRARRKLSKTTGKTTDKDVSFGVWKP